MRIFAGRRIRTAALAAASTAALAAPRAVHGQATSARPASATSAPSASSASGTFAPALYQDLHYRMVGPSRGGRVTTVAGDPKHPGTFYFGSTGGGVWKSEDYGQHWHNTTDGTFSVGSMGSVVVAPSNADVLYAGTGSDGIRSNVSIGRGIYRSDDAAKTWRFLGLRDVGQIGSVMVHPTNPDVVWAGAIGSPFGKGPERGVYKTTDGGRTWRKVLFVSDSVGVVDLELKPGDPNTIYAAAWRVERKPWTIISGAKASSGDGIWKSTDGGEHWARLTKGLPSGLVGKIDLAVTPAAPDRVYALVETTDPGEGLYRSDDGGATWSLASSQHGIMNRPFYYTNVTADPKNADLVYVMNEGFYVSTDGGHSFQRRGTPHGDNHDLWIAPYDSNVMIESNDGGANVSLDGGKSWSTQLNQPTAEIYQVDTDNSFPYRLYGAQQDNTTISVPSLPLTTSPPDAYSAWWKQIGGCETGPAVPKPDDPAIVYSNCKGRFGVYNDRTGQEKDYAVGEVYMYGTPPRDLPYRYQRVVPIEVSPNDPDIVYNGSQYVMKTTDGGQHWQRISPDLTADEPQYQGVSGEPITRDMTGEEVYSVLYVIEESPLQPGLIWTGANDGPVHVTRDGGKTWTDVTPKGLPHGARIQNIEPSPWQPGEAYVAAYAYLLDDWKPYIFRTTDYGTSWTLLTDGTNGIAADEPTRVVREDPVREGLLYAGTEFGMYVSFDEGAHWQSLQLNLPAVPVTDIEVHDDDVVLSTQGRSFWILDDVAPLRQLTPDVADARAHLFQPDTAVRMRYYAFGQDPSDPEYPEVGARIDYSLGTGMTGPVSVDILGPDGAVIRSFSSEGPGETTTLPAEPALRGDSLVRAGTPALETGPGMHRFTWDLRYPGPWDADARRSGRRGPMAVPGDYTVRLTAGGTTQTQPLHVMLDPRVTTSGVTQADVEAQLQLALQIRDALTRARVAAARLTEAEKALKDKGDAASKRKLQRLQVVRDSLLTKDLPSYPQPMLVDQIEYLYSAETGADQHPGQDAYERLEALTGQLVRLVRRLDDVLK